MISFTTFNNIPNPPLTVEILEEARRLIEQRDGLPTLYRGIPIVSTDYLDAPASFQSEYPMEAK